MLPERSDQFVFLKSIDRVVNITEDVVILCWFLVRHKIRKILHFKMFFISSSYDLMSPYEKESTEKRGVRLEARLISKFLMDLKLRFRLLLLHLYLYQFFALLN